MRVVRTQGLGVSELLSQFLTSANCSQFAEIRGYTLTTKMEGEI